MPSAVSVAPVLMWEDTYTVLTGVSDLLAPPDDKLGVSEIECADHDAYWRVPSRTTVIF